MSDETTPQDSAAMPPASAGSVGGDPRKYPASTPQVSLVPAEMYHALVVAHAEIARLREAIRRLAEQDATLSVCDGNVTVTMDATLTDAEREAVEIEARHADAACRYEIAATLRGLLERTK